MSSLFDNALFNSIEKNERVLQSLSILGVMYIYGVELTWLGVSLSLQHRWTIPPAYTAITVVFRKFNTGYLLLYHKLIQSTDYIINKLCRLFNI